MSLAIDITDGRGLGNELRHDISTAKEERGNAVFVVNFTVKSVTLSLKYVGSLNKIKFVYVGVP